MTPRAAAIEQSAALQESRSASSSRRSTSRIYPGLTSPHQCQPYIAGYGGTGPVGCGGVDGGRGAGRLGRRAATAGSRPRRGSARGDRALPAPCRDRGPGSSHGPGRPGQVRRQLPCRAAPERPAHRRGSGPGRAPEDGSPFDALATFVPFGQHLDVHALGQTRPLARGGGPPAVGLGQASAPLSTSARWSSSRSSPMPCPPRASLF